MQPSNKTRIGKVSAIVPAYNEAKNIATVLKVLRQVPVITEIIVVSDGSTDATTQIARSFNGVKVIELPQNVGKTKAISRGVAEAKHSALLFCDADLVNLCESQFFALISRYFEGYDMVIQDKGSQPWVFRVLLKSVPALSGTRILDREHFSRVPFRRSDRFQFENRINNYFMEQGLSVAIVPAPEVHDTRKYRKYPFWKGLVLDIKGALEVAFSDGPLNVHKNLLMFRKIHSLSSPPKQ